MLYEPVLLLSDLASLRCGTCAEPMVNAVSYPDHYPRADRQGIAKVPEEHLSSLEYRPMDRVRIVMTVLDFGIDTGPDHGTRTRDHASGG